MSFLQFCNIQQRGKWPEQVRNPLAVRVHLALNRMIKATFALSIQMVNAGWVCGWRCLLSVHEVPDFLTKTAVYDSITSMKNAFGNTLSLRNWWWHW